MIRRKSSADGPDLPVHEHEGTFTGSSVGYQPLTPNMQVMRILSRLTALVMALLLLAQVGWAMPECATAETLPQPTGHHSMPAGQHDHMPAPADHHSSCQLAVCAAMSGCAPAALHTTTLGIAPAAGPTALIIALQATSSPAGPQAPDPPPPRA